MYDFICLFLKKQALSVPGQKDVKLHLCRSEGIFVKQRYSAGGNSFIDLEDEAYIACKILQKYADSNPEKPKMRRNKMFFIRHSGNRVACQASSQFLHIYMDTPGCVAFDDPRKHH